MSWKSLKGVLKCLLTGSPLLEKLSLISLPCSLDSVLQDVLPIARIARFQQGFARPRPRPQYLTPVALRQLQHVNLSRTDVSMITVQRILRCCKKLTHVDLSHCWHIKEIQWHRIKASSNVHIVWV